MENKVFEGDKVAGQAGLQECHKTEQAATQKCHETGLVLYSGDECPLG